MHTLQTALASPPFRRWLAAIAVLAGSGVLVAVRQTAVRNELVATAARLDSRLTEARLAYPLEHRPVGGAPAGAFNDVAATLYARWRSDASPQSGRSAGAALLLAGSTDRAVTLLRDLLRQSTGEPDILAAIQRCTDAPLLTDYSAAEWHAAGDGDARRLLLALEAADRAWKLGRTPAAAWNRALAADRLGAPSAAARAWREAEEAETPGGWKREAAERRAQTEREMAAPPPESNEVFFYRESIRRVVDQLDGRTAGDATAEVRRIDPVANDHLASDTVAALVRLGPRDARRARSAINSYVRGRTAFEGELYADACAAFTTAEAELAALRLPLQLLARDQRIRCQCSRAEAGCLGDIRRFRSELMASGRYPWLAARAASAEGQTLFRAGRIYEAAEAFERARTELRALRDSASESLLHSQIANAFAAAGETELALSHYLDALRSRSEAVGDRRRKQLEDVMTFTLQHGYVAASEMLLDELAAAPATAAARVMEASLRGVVAARRGDAAAAARHFDRAGALLETVSDPSVRGEVTRSLAIAAAGWRVQTARGIAGIEAAIARQREQNSVWMPLLLVERGAALEQRNDLAAAEADYLRAIDILEQREPRIDATMLSLGVAAERDSAFDRLIRLYLGQRRIGEALAISQRSAALRISSLHARGIGVRDVYRGVRGAAAADAVAELRAALRSGHAAVAYHVLRDELITWVVTREEIFAVRRRVRSRDLIRAAEELRACAARRSCDVERISDLLLRDWIQRVPREATLLIQPVAELQAVPFAMLRTRAGELLLTRNAATFAPSFRAFLRAAQNDAGRMGHLDAYLAAAGRPGGDLEPLPRAAAEVTRASRSYRRAVVETATSRADFLALAAQFAVVHFAGHVLANDEQPLLSALVFERSTAGGSQMLYVHELDGRAFARARLIVLSACETGRAPRPTMSMANALLSQNVPSVVYTLWPVDDEAAEAFAIRFHRSIAAGRSRAEAVRSAQRSLMEMHPTRPDWWAAFAIAGAHVPLT